MVALLHNIIITVLGETQLDLEITIGRMVGLNLCDFCSTTGIELLKCFFVQLTTPRRSTCGQSAASWLRSTHSGLSSPEPARSMRYSRFAQSWELQRRYNVMYYNYILHLLYKGYNCVPKCVLVVQSQSAEMHSYISHLLYKYKSFFFGLSIIASITMI